MGPQGFERRPLGGAVGHAVQLDPKVNPGPLEHPGSRRRTAQPVARIFEHHHLSAGKPIPMGMLFPVEGQGRRALEGGADLLGTRHVLAVAADRLEHRQLAHRLGLPLELEHVRTLEGDLHSGLFGGAAPNAIETLVHLLGRLKTPDGKIHIPGLYEAVARPSVEERAGWKKLPFNDKRFLRDEVQGKALTGLKGYPTLERLWALPTFEVHGIVGGFTGEGSKTVIPAVATAKVSLRLVPRQKTKTVGRLLTAAVKKLAPPWAKVSVKMMHGADPVLVKTSAPPFRLIDQAYREVEGRGIVQTRSGGSIPIVADFEKHLKIPSVMMGFGLPDDNLHAPNEKYHIPNFYRGIESIILFLQRVGGDHKA